MSYEIFLIKFFTFFRPLSGSFSQLLKRRHTSSETDANTPNDTEPELNDHSSIDTDLGPNSGGSSEYGDTPESEYDDTSESEDDEPEQPPPELPRWVLEHTFNSNEELDAFVEGEKIWSTRSTVSLASGFKTLYRCNLVVSKQVQCEAEAYSLRYVIDDDDGDDQVLGAVQPKYRYDFFRKNADHTHDDEGMIASNQIADEVREKIIVMHKNGLKPATVRLRLRGDATIEPKDQPSKRQIYNAINLHKNEQVGKDPITMNDLVKFVGDNAYDPNKDEDHPFVVKFERSAPTDPQRTFRYFVSTTRLLRYASEAKILHADGTFKITTEKLPLIVVGSSDADGRFHLIGLEITSHENGVAYECAFNAVKEGTGLITGKEIKPEYLVCDADGAIHNGFRAVFGNEPIIIMCYAHVISNVQRKYRFRDEKNRNKVLNDIRSLHLCSDKSNFDIGWALFKKKWISVEKLVVNRFEKSFVFKCFNWFLGAGQRVPKTNNLLERFNGTLKQFQTLYQKKPMKQFLNHSLRIVAERSQEYRMDKAEFSIVRSITDEQIREGCEFDLKFVSTDEANENGAVECYSHAKNPQQLITMDEIQDWLNAKYKNFEEFAENHCKIVATTFSEDLQEWRNATCTCKPFDDNYMCKHIISIAHQTGIVDGPTVNYDDKPLFEVKKGRPAKASKKPLQKD